MMTLLPLLYMLGGMLLGRVYPQARTLLAKGLTLVLIPYVIFYNLLTYQPGTLLVAGFAVVFCTLLFLIARRLSEDPVDALTFSYLNIGWLGLPLALALFGDAAGRIIIAAYVGGSVFGNVAAAAALQPQSSRWILLKRTVLAWPFLAAVVGGLLHLIWPALGEWTLLAHLYTAAKPLMSIFGMAILGIWLYHAKITRTALYQALHTTLRRALIGGVLVAGFIGLGHALAIPLIEQHYWVFLMLPLLPPAANTVVLETYYRGTGHSAQTIASGTLISLGLLGIFALVVQGL